MHTPTIRRISVLLAAAAGVLALVGCPPGVNPYTGFFGDVVYGPTEFWGSTVDGPIGVAALDNGNAMLAFRGYDTAWALRYKIIGPDTTPVSGGDFETTSTAQAVAAAPFGDGSHNVLLAYELPGSKEGRYLVLGQGGSSVKTSTAFDTWDTVGGSFWYITAAGASDGTVAIAYRDNEDWSKGKFLTFDSTGAPALTETLFTETEVQEPRMTTIPSTGNLLLACYKGGVPLPGEFVIFTPEGVRVFPPSGSEIFETNGVVVLSVAAFGNGNVLIAYTTQDDASKGKFVVYDEDGALVAGKTVFSTANPSAIAATTLSDGNVLLAFEEYDTGLARITVVDPHGAVVFGPWTFETRAITALSVSKLADGRFIVAYRMAADGHGSCVVVE